MSVTVIIPSAMRDASGNNSTVSAEGETIAEVFSDVGKQYPEFRAKIYDSDGKMHQYIACFLNDTDVRSLDGDNTSVSDGDEITIIAAIAGG